MNRILIIIIVVLFILLCAMHTGCVSYDPDKNLDFPKSNDFEVGRLDIGTIYLGNSAFFEDSNFNHR
jgi:hypothetical protein